MTLFFTGEHRRDLLQAFQRLRLQRILQKNLRLHDQIFQRLHLAAFFGNRLRGISALGARLARLRNVRRAYRAGLGKSGLDPLQETVIGAAAHALDAFLIAMVVGIDIHEPFDRVAGLRDISAIQVNVKQLDQDFEVLRFAVQLIVQSRPEFQDGLRRRMLRSHAVHLRREIILSLVRKHALLQHQQEFHRFRVLPRRSVQVDEFQQARDSFVFLAQESLKDFPGAIELPGRHERVSVGVQKVGVFFGSREWLQQRCGLRGIA